MGEIGYKHILSELVHLPAEDRPATAAARVGDGDYLAYAIGCRWVSELGYVYNEGGGDDVHAYFWENFEKARSAIRLAALTEGDIQGLFNLQTPTLAYSEPRVHLRQIRWDAYTSPAPFDLIFLARSKPFTPAEADRKRFVDSRR
jgi:hypothetical protein